MGYEDPIKAVKGDILNNIKRNNATIILHGCNCFQAMGGGIARYLADQFPQIEEADCMFHSCGDRVKMGMIDDPILVSISMNIVIINCYTQFEPGGTQDYDELAANIQAIRLCLKKVKKWLNINFTDISLVDIRSPKIGCGIAGGSWLGNDDHIGVHQIFKQELPEATIYEL